MRRTSRLSPRREDPGGVIEILRSARDHLGDDQIVGGRAARTCVRSLSAIRSASTTEYMRRDWRLLEQAKREFWLGRRRRPGVCRVDTPRSATNFVGRCWPPTSASLRPPAGKGQDRLARFRCARGEASEAAAAIEAVPFLSLAPADQTQAVLDLCDRRCAMLPACQAPPQARVPPHGGADF